MALNLKEYLERMVGKEEADYILDEYEDGPIPATICVTGPICSGKTTLVRVLKELGFNAVDVNECWTLTTKDDNFKYDPDFDVLLPNGKLLNGDRSIPQ